MIEMLLGVSEIELVLNMRSSQKISKPSNANEFISRVVPLHVQLIYE